jgi:phosphatidylinositol glycan class B
LLFLLCAAFTSFHHWDEYFQIVEPASAKLGRTSPANLTWDYQEKMRPWLQPAFYVGLARAAAVVGIDRPLTLLFLFRLFTGVISWVALWSLVVAGRHWIEDEEERRRLYSIAAFLWLVPYLGVRTSSETMATSALCLGIALLEYRTAFKTEKARVALAAFAGAALGLCFEFRYGSAAMAAGAALWYLVRAQKPILFFSTLSAGALLGLLVGGLADWWGYGSATFPFFSYVYQNFVLHRANTFGTAPFFAYLYLPLATPMAPLVLFLMAATFLSWGRRPGSVLTWATVPYVLVLSLTPHKEDRFLFPLVPFLPFFVVFALAAKPPAGSQFASHLRWFATGARLKFMLALNAAGLAGVLLLKAGNFPLYRILENESYASRGATEVALLHTQGDTPYARGGAQLTFLEPTNLIRMSNPPVADLEARIARGETFLALIEVPVGPPEPADWIRNRCAFEWSSYPRWLRPYNFFKWQERSYWWEFYRCGPGRS